MSFSKIIQLFHFINHRVQCKKNIFIFTFIFMLLTLHISFYFYFSKSLTSSSPPHISSEGPIFAPIVVGLSISFFGFFLGDILFAWSLNKYNERLLNKTVEKGTRPEIDVSDDEFVPRPLVVDRLKKIFQPYRNQSFYHVVCGEHGTGKTTLTKIASNDVGCGVIYVDIPADLDELGEAFRRAINFAYVDRISLLGQLMRKTHGKPKTSELGSFMRALNYASKVYKTKHDKPMLIVYDNVSHLVNENPKILDILQDDAKHSADDRKYIVIFVSSEGSVPRRMQSRSSWSRADTVIEIGDLSKKESMEYLNKRKIDKAEATKLYELVGGRIVNLKSVADKFHEGQSFEVIKQNILIKVKDNLRTAKLLEKQDHHDVGKRVIEALSKFKELKRTEFEKIFNKYEEANEVLESNVFAYHPERNTVTFQSRTVECYIQENANIFLNYKK